MLKILKKPTIIAAHVCIVVILFLCACGGSGATMKSNRNIIVDELNGSASVLSSDSTETDAYKGRKLISGDAVTVAADSDMTIEIDKDKHLFADGGSRFAIEAAGKKGATETEIRVEEGCNLIGIDNKLSDAESFTVSTPNAVMAVRGTVFKVTVTATPEGYETELFVKEGIVEVRTIEDGQEKKELVDQGQTVVYSGAGPDAASKEENEKIASTGKEDQADTNPQVSGTEVSDYMELKTTTGQSMSDYLTERQVEAITVNAKIYSFEEYYDGDSTLVASRSGNTSGGHAGYVIEFSSPVTFDGHTVTVCTVGGDVSVHEDILDRVYALGQGEFFGYFQPYVSGIDDITEQVIGTPTYSFDIIECK